VARIYSPDAGLHGPPHRVARTGYARRGRPGLRLYCRPGVPAHARRTLVPFARWLRYRLPFRHHVPVEVVPEACIETDQGLAWAAFYAPTMPGDSPRIYLAGGSAAVMRRLHGWTTQRALRVLRVDLAHEVVHYEQWRDGREMTERGVDERARRLVREYEAWAA
jgi:hypothetical protein